MRKCHAKNFLGCVQKINLPLISMEKSSSDGAEQMLMIEPEIEIRENEKSEGDEK